MSGTAFASMSLGHRIMLLLCRTCDELDSCIFLMPYLIQHLGSAQGRKCYSRSQNRLYSD